MSKPAIIPQSVLSPDFKAAFWARVKVTAGCWEWQGKPGGRGYGRMRKPGRGAQLRAHRLAYFLHHEVDPGDMLVCHSCDNPMCVRPDHLFLGTDADNMADKARKGRNRTVPQGGERNNNAKLTEAQVRDVMARIMAGETNTAISAGLPVSHAVISSIRTGRIWRAVSLDMGYEPRPSKQAPKSGRTAFRGRS